MMISYFFWLNFEVLALRAAASYRAFAGQIWGIMHLTYRD
jgi:hypothetical protein